MKPNRGGAILALGICGLVVCGPLGTVAWIMANQDLAEMDRGLMDSQERQMTTAGKICGIVGTCVFLLGIGMILLLFVIPLVMAAGAAVVAPKQVDFLPDKPASPSSSMIWTAPAAEENGFRLHLGA